MFRITKLVVKNYGPFRESIFEFNENSNSKELAEVQMITGENGTGKSSILYALTLPENQKFVLQRCHDQKNGNSVIEVHYSQGQPTIMICEKGRLEYSSQNEIVKNEFKRFERTYRQHDFEFGMFAYSSYRNIHSTIIKGIQELDNSPVLDAMKFQQGHSRQFLQWIANMKAREANAYYQNQIEKRDQAKAATKRIEDAIKDIIEEPFEFIFNDDPFEVNIKVDNQVYPFDVLPDGLKSILSWLGDMLMRLDRMPWKNNIPVNNRNLILFLDEIDVHLHPKWQRQVLYIVQKLFPNAQIFVSTHSPFVASSIGDAYIHELEKVEGYAKLAETMPTNIGSSYHRIINEVFSIDSEFSPQIEKEIERFYSLKSEIMDGDSSKLDEANLLAFELSKISEEVHALLSYELRQLQKAIK